MYVSLPFDARQEKRLSGHGLKDSRWIVSLGSLLEVRWFGLGVGVGVGVQWRI